MSKFIAVMDSNERLEIEVESNNYYKTVRLQNTI
jgi:hypothetical protein